MKTEKLILKLSFKKVKNVSNRYESILSTLSENCIKLINVGYIVVKDENNQYNVFFRFRDDQELIHSCGSLKLAKECAFGNCQLIHKKHKVDIVQ